MKRADKKFAVRHFALRLMLIVLCLTLASNCLGARMALLLKQTPAEGGTVEPGTGVHQFSGQSQVTLRAVPKNGYQFVTWLGEVDDSQSPTTTAYMDSPKIVVAVFEKVQYDVIAGSDAIFSSSLGGAFNSAADISSGGGSGGGGKRRSSNYGYNFPDTEELEDDDLLGPGDPLMGPGEQVPEPTTLVLLVSGLAMTRLRRKKTIAKNAL